MEYQLQTFFLVLWRVRTHQAIKYTRGNYILQKTENESYSPIFFYYTSFLSRLFQIDIFLNTLIKKKDKYKSGEKHLYERNFFIIYRKIY